MLKIEDKEKERQNKITPLLDHHDDKPKRFKISTNKLNRLVSLDN